MFAAFIAMSGCQLPSKNLGDPDSSSDPSTSTSTASATGTPDMTPTEGSSGTDSGATDPSTSTSGAIDPSTSGGTDPSTSSGTDTGAPVDPICAQPPDLVTGPSWPDEYALFPPSVGILNEQCVLEATHMVDGDLKFVLDCPLYEQENGLDTVEFVIVSGPMPTLPPIGALIDANGVFSADIGIEAAKDAEMLILRSEGELVYGTVRALHLDPVLAAEFYMPLALAPVELCPLKFFAEAPDGDDFACERGARAQLRVTAPGLADLLLLDDESTQFVVGPTTYNIDVRRAWQVENCGPNHPQGVLDMVAFAIAAQ